MLISWIDFVQNEAALRRVKQERNVNWIGYILLSNWLLEHVIGANADGQIK
jgi:hypothetical protein